MTINYLHVLGVALVVLNAVLAALAGDPSQYGITQPYVGAWLALVVLAIGMILKELPSTTQTLVINQQKHDLVALGDTRNRTAPPPPPPPPPAPKPFTLPEPIGVPITTEIQGG